MWLEKQWKLQNDNFQCQLDMIRILKVAIPEYIVSFSLSLSLFDGSCCCFVFLCFALCYLLYFKLIIDKMDRLCLCRDNFLWWDFIPYFALFFFSFFILKKNVLVSMGRRSKSPKQPTITTADILNGSSSPLRPDSNVKLPSDFVCVHHPATLMIPVDCNHR